MNEEKVLNRFYYSPTQRIAISEVYSLSLKDNDKSTFIRLDDGTEREYTEWCLGNGHSNWEDAELIVEFVATIAEASKRIFRK